jgi:cell division initiation protein
MNITPIEIRQKEFERHFRGYDKDEVNAFLHTLSQAWERLLEENREKTARLEKAEKDIDKVREVEGSLFRTLRTAEDTSAGIVNKAQREAEEVQQQAERQRQEIIEEAHRQAASIVEEAHQQVIQLRQEVAAAENHRQQVLAQLQALAQGILQRIGEDGTAAKPVERSLEKEHTTPAETIERTEVSAVEDPAEQQDSDILATSTSEEESGPAEEEATHPEEPAEVYEPVWATDEEAPPPSEAGATKRRSFFDELD